MRNNKYKKLITGSLASVVAAIAPYKTFAADTSADAGKVNSFMLDLLNTVLFVVGGAAALVIAIAGLIYVFSTGNPEKLDKAKSAIVYALIGAALAIAATTIAKFFVGLATKNFGG